MLWPETLGQLPKELPKGSSNELLKQLAKTPSVKLQLVAKTSVEELAEELGLTLGDQNELTIRRIKRGKGYTFIRANGTRIRHAGTIRRLNRMAVPPPTRKSAIRRTRTRICRLSAAMPPGGCNTAITPIGRRSASSAKRIAWPSWSRRSRRSGVTSICIWPATSRRANSRCRR